ncbi:unnamed protein product [Amoebophrya sp. A25]|nr:unnamed protein product [Amoebophrya sp. A25]|eukprot:GSA25T00020258001.1
MMDEDRAKVKELEGQLDAHRRELKALRLRLLTGKKADVREKELLKQIEELQALLKKKHPDSILNMLGAVDFEQTEKAETRNEEVSSLQEEVARLRKEVADKELDFDRQLRAFRAQYDKLVYEQESEKLRERLLGGSAGLSPGGSGKAGNSNGGATAVLSREATRTSEGQQNQQGQQEGRQEAVLKARVRDLERQLEHQKTYYLGKLRSKDPLVPSTLPRANASTAGAPGAKRVQEQEERISSLEHEKAQLEIHNRQLLMRLKDASEGTTSSSTTNKRAPIAGSGTTESSSGYKESRYDVGQPGVADVDYNPYRSVRFSEYVKDKGENKMQIAQTTSQPSMSTTMESGDFIQFSPSLLRVLFAQPFGLVVGVLERATVGLLSSAGSGASANLQKKSVCAFLRGMIARRQADLHANGTQALLADLVYPSQDMLARAITAVQASDGSALRSLIDNAILQKFAVSKGNEHGVEQAPHGGELSMALYLFSLRWRESKLSSSQRREVGSVGAQVLTDELGILEQDLKVHHGHQGLSLEWQDLLAAVQRCGPWSPELKLLLADSQALCPSTTRIFWPKLKTLLVYGAQGGEEQPSGFPTRGLASFCSVLHSLRRLRNRAIWQKLLNSFRAADAGCSGVVSKPLFLQVLHDHLVQEEPPGADSAEQGQGGKRKQEAVVSKNKSSGDLLSDADLQMLSLFFDRAGEGVDWMLLLQDLVQQGSGGQQVWRNFFNDDQGVLGTAEEQDAVATAQKTEQRRMEIEGDPVSPSEILSFGPQNISGRGKAEVARLNLLCGELQRQKETLQRELDMSRSRADTLSQQLLHSVRQGERSLPQNLQQIAANVTLLEKNLLARSEKLREEFEKKEISLGTELRIKTHELTQVQQLLRQKEMALLAQRDEMDVILKEMNQLRLKQITAG